MISMETPSIPDFFVTNELHTMSGEYPFYDNIEGEDYLNDNTNSFQNFNPGQGERRPRDLLVDSENSWFQPIYAENCPYKKGEAFDNLFVVHKKFRLVEEFP